MSEITAIAYSDTFCRLSGLREIALVQEMNVYGALGVEYQYMGERGGGLAATRLYVGVSCTRALEPAAHFAHVSAILTMSPAQWLDVYRSSYL